jgi:hypothetical protein
MFADITDAGVWGTELVCKLFCIAPLSTWLTVSNSQRHIAPVTEGSTRGATPIPTGTPRPPPSHSTFDNQSASKHHEL